MNGSEKSDSAIRAMKPANNVGKPTAEWAEQRAGTKGSVCQPHTRRFITQPGTDKQRLLGIAVLENKVVQRALVAVLNAIYEEGFFGFSYGLRPGRGQHDAMDALAVAICDTPVNWILDADIQSFFDSVSQEWLVRCIDVSGNLGQAPYRKSLFLHRQVASRVGTLV